MAADPNPPSTPSPSSSEGLGVDSGATVIEPRVESDVAESLVEAIAAIPAPETMPAPLPDDSFDTDIAILGAGPGGYVAAIRAAQLGAKVTVIEREYLGGTCLNWGCIPSKAMIASVERLHEVHDAERFGVTGVKDAGSDFGVLMARKDKIVMTQRGGVAYLFKKNGVTHIEGDARFLDRNTLEISKEGEEARRLTARHFIVATGSSAVRFNIPGLEGGREEGVWTSDDAVTAPFVPKRMVILGGGAVGCEFSYVFNGLGAEITLVELAEGLIPFADKELGTELGKLLGRSGITIKTGTTIDRVERKGEEWHVTLKKGETEEVVVCDVVLLGVGRKANSDGLGLEEIGVQMHRRGIQVVDDTMRTHVDNIYAIGDVTGRIQLAHVASHEGIVAATNIVNGGQDGKPKLADYKAVPNCVYTSPEVASVGLTEAQAREQGYDVKIGKFAFRPLGKPMATGEQEGFVKVVAESKYGEVLGVHMIGAHVTDMIHEAVAAIKLEATLDVMVDTIHAHPTMSEAVLEAFEDAQGHAIHKA
ncbi:MAG: dihydrolipoyl dehydrogenase [Armatimonadota bacterium]